MNLKQIISVTCVLLFASCTKQSSDVEFISVIDELEVPIYDKNNPEMAVIRTAEEWVKVNDKSKRIFFIEPGDFTSHGEIILSVSGTSNRPRWLIWKSEKSEMKGTHPVHMESAQRVSFRKMTIKGDYWIIDRLHGSGYKDQTRTAIVSLEGKNNIINRSLFEFGSSGGGQVAILGDSNVIQNSVLRNTMITPGRDNHGIVFQEHTDYSKVLNCEIYNCSGDAIQIHPSENEHKGCQIINNDIYIDASLYFEPIKEFPHENGIDFKDGGSADPANWIRVEKNRFAWIGSSTGGTGGSPGAIDFSNASGHKSYILFADNVFYQCALPFTTATGDDGGSSNHLTIIRNVFYAASIAALKPVTQNQFSHEYYFNTIVNVLDTGLWIESDMNDSDIMGNLIINGKNQSVQANSGVEVDFNVYYNTELMALEGANSRLFDIEELNKNEDYCFNFKNITKSEVLCIPSIVPTKESSHMNLFEHTTFGKNINRGVDDQLYWQGWAGALKPMESMKNEEELIIN